PQALVSRFPLLSRLRRNAVQQHLDTATESLRKKAFETAEADLGEALALEPMDNDALNVLGTFYFEKREVTKAVEVFNKVLTSEPLNATALKGRAYALDLSGNVGDAIYDYLRYVQISPDDAEVTANYISALLTVGQVPEAIRLGLKAAERFSAD